MLRLTLRTLLAYLDDTLEPAQAKQIGEKVAESDLAQQMVERIKTVTRRRRLTAPPVEADDHSTDPNVMAEYLDNVLPPGEVADLEQVALDNDLKLAEVAACHQILTLVLGEPAKVPPTARRRMYRLVKGPEAIPYRQPTAANTPVAGVAAPAAADEFHDPAEEDLLESFLGPRSLLWIVSLFAVVGVLVVAVWLAIPPTPPPAPGYIAVNVPRPEPKPQPAPPTPAPETPVEPKEPPVSPVPPAPPAPAIEPDLGPAPRVVDAAPPAVRAADAERRVVAAYDLPRDPLLVRKRETTRWERVDPAAPQVNSTDTLLALPGFHPEVQLTTGPRLQLWGNAPDVLPVPVAESELTLYVPPRGLAGDLRLSAGRLFLTAPKAMNPTAVRVRFLEEVWDVTLRTPQTEVAIDLIGEPARGPLFDRAVPEAPRYVAYLGVIQGSAALRVGFQESGELPAGARWKWDSKGGRPGPAPKDDPDVPDVANWWSRAVPNTPAAKDMAAAAAEMARRVGTSAGPFAVDFDATLKDPQEALSRRVLSAWMLAAVDGIEYLIDALEVENATVRAAAAEALRYWVAQAPSHEPRLVELLADKAAYSDAERSLLVALVRAPQRPPTAETVTRLFELLRESKLAVRELARMQLARLDPAGARESGYDAASDRRALQAQAWERSLQRRAKAKE